MRSRLVPGRVIQAILLVATSVISCFPALAEGAKHPLIGINVDMTDAPREASVPCYYFEAVEKSGGIPVLLPPMDTESLQEMLNKLDGLLLIGGADYPPQSYGAEIESKTKTMPKARADFDLTLARSALKMQDLPILGICAGCQLLNISEGGSLVQDIPSKFPDSKVIHGGPYDSKKGPRMHEISFEKNSMLDKLYGKTSLSVPTSHHQCLGKIASDLKVVAKTGDGLPEAVEQSGSRFIVGVQWHPERDFENNKALFAEFLKNAQAHLDRTSKDH